MVLEALAAGVPVVTSDYQALPEVVGAGGLVVPEGDQDALVRAIVEALDPERNAQLTERARARHEEAYSPDVVRRKLARCYERAVSEERAGDASSASE